MKKLVFLGVALTLVLAMVGLALPARASADGVLPNWDINDTWNGWSYIAAYTFVMNVTSQDSEGNFGGTMTYPTLGINATVSGKVTGDTLTSSDKTGVRTGRSSAEMWGLRPCPETSSI